MVSILDSNKRDSIVNSGFKQGLFWIQMGTSILDSNKDSILDSNKDFNSVFKHKDLNSELN